MKDQLSSNARLVYFVVDDFARKGEKSPSVAMMARAANVCKHTIRRGRAELVEEGFLEIHHHSRRMPNGKKMSLQTSYKLLRKLKLNAGNMRRQPEGIRFRLISERQFMDEVGHAMPEQAFL